RAGKEVDCDDGFHVGLTWRSRTQLKVYARRLSVGLKQWSLPAVRIFRNGFAGVARALPHADLPRLGEQLALPRRNDFFRAFGRANRIFDARLKEGHAPKRERNGRAGRIQKSHLELKVGRFERRKDDA